MNLNSRIYVCKKYISDEKKIPIFFTVNNYYL